VFRVANGPTWKYSGCDSPTRNGKLKVKVTLEQTMKAQMESRGIALILSLTPALDGSGWSTPRLNRFTSGKEIR
jgi:hypothetical protein